jgi:hypothetical protein
MGVVSRAGLAVCFFLSASPAISAADKVDPLSEARQFYNERQFDAALTAAELARATPALADRADLIAARAYLERFRESASPADLTDARERLRRIDPQRFEPLERTEFIVGLGEALYFDESYGTAADVFETVLDDAGVLPANSRDRVLDGWAIAVDRDAWVRPEPWREGAYQRIRARMRDELTTHPGSSTAAYWLAAAARSQGDLQAAWNAVEAGWVRASFASDHGAAARADLDRLMLVAIIPERAKLLAQPAGALRLDWERFKERWRNPQ